MTDLKEFRKIHNVQFEIRVILLIDFFGLFHGVNIEILVPGPVPNDDGRKQILKIHTKNMALDEEADLDLLSSLTDGLSGADLKAVCTEAGMFAIREKRDRVTVTDFMDAVEKVLDKEHDDEFIKEAGVMFA